MQEVEHYCNGASHNRVNRQPAYLEYTTEEAEEKRILWMALLVSTKQVNLILDQT